MAAGPLQPTSPTPGAHEVDPATRGNREQRRRSQGRRTQRNVEDGDEESQHETDTTAVPGSHRVDVLA